MSIRVDALAQTECDDQAGCVQEEQEQTPSSENDFEEDEQEQFDNAENDGEEDSGDNADEPASPTP